MDANHFELKPAFIIIVQQDQFCDFAIDNLNAYLAMFFQVADTIKMNDIGEGAIHFRLFLFSLKDKAFNWLHSTKSGNINKMGGDGGKFLEQISTFQVFIIATRD